MKQFIKVVGYIVVLLASVLFIYYGNQYIDNHAVQNGILYDREEELDTLVFAKVSAIEEKNASDITFQANIIKDKQRQNEVIQGKQLFNSDAKNVPPVSVGDKVVLLSYGEEYLFQYYYRFDQVIQLGILLMAGILILGGIKGFHTIVSLTFTCLSIFFVFIPSIKAGYNIYASTALICFYIINMTFFIIYGLSRKSVTACLSCIAGILFSGAVSVGMNTWMKLSGYMNDDMYLLQNLFGIPIDVRAILYAMITIGALGAIMDVSMSITSSLCELKEHNAEIQTGDLIRSGLHIGRDIMGTMANTLILAYIGSSLVVVLIYAGSGYPLLSILNKEEIIFQFLQSLIGSLSLLITIPITSWIASVVLSAKKERIRQY